VLARAAQILLADASGKAENALAIGGRIDNVAGGLIDAASMVPPIALLAKRSRRARPAIG
jgi:hypothetical protein